MQVKHKPQLIAETVELVPKTEVMEQPQLYTITKIVLNTQPSPMLGLSTG